MCLHSHMHDAVPNCPGKSSLKMAVHNPQACCTTMCGIMADSTEIIGALSKHSLQGCFLSNKLSDLQALQDKMKNAYTLVTTVQLISPSMAQYHTKFLIGFTSLLAILAPQISMHYGQTVSEGCQTDTTVIQQLWGVLFHSTNFFTLFPTAWPSIQPVVSPLKTAINTMLTVLLHITRQEKWLITPAVKPAGLKNDLAVILAPAINCLTNVSQAPPKLRLTQLKKLPSTMISTLCCIISDQLSVIPRFFVPSETSASSASLQAAWTAHTRRHPFFLYSFFKPIHHALNLLLDEHTTQDGNTELIDLISTPAIQHAWKCFLLSPIPDTELADELYFNAMHCLVRLLRNFSYLSSPTHDATSYSSRERNESLLPRFSQSQSADWQLVRVLCRRMSEDLQYTEMGYMLMRAIVKSALIPRPESPFGVPAFPDKVQVSQSLTKIANQCMQHGLQRMLHFKRQRVQQRAWHQQRGQQNGKTAETPTTELAWLFKAVTIQEATATMSVVSSLGSPSSDKAAGNLSLKFTACIMLQAIKMKILVNLCVA